LKNSIKKIKITLFYQLIPNTSELQVPAALVINNKFNLN